MLSDLPAEACSPDLVERILIRLAVQRRNENRIRTLLLVLHGLAGATGLWILAGRKDRILVAVRNASTQGALDWIALAILSPTDALMELLISIDAWMESLTVDLEVGIVIALILLILPTLSGLFGLLKSTRLSEGVG
jgi:hypothetical protein